MIPNRDAAAHALGFHEGFQGYHQSLQWLLLLPFFPSWGAPTLISIYYSKGAKPRKDGNWETPDWDFPFIINFWSLKLKFIRNLYNRVWLYLIMIFVVNVLMSIVGAAMVNKSCNENYAFLILMPAITEIH